MLLLLCHEGLELFWFALGGHLLLLPFAVDKGIVTGSPAVEIQGVLLQNGPTKGGSEENKKYNDWYSKTLESYVSIFGTNAPVNIWPEPNIRFRSNQLWQWIDASKYFIISRSAGLILFVMVMLISFMFIFLLIS